METGTLILLVSLCVAAVAGTTSVYLLLRARDRREAGQAVQEQRLRQLESELRRAQETGPAASPPAVGPMPPMMPFPSPPVSGMSRPGPTPLDPNRFANEPPLFGEAPAAAAASKTRPSPAQSAGPAPTAPTTATAAPDPATPFPAAPEPTPAKPEPQIAAQAMPPVPAAVPDPVEPPPASPPAFKSVSDHLAPGDPGRLDWLADLTAGRRVTLHRLGYDAPEKIANLSASEIRRLAAATEVDPDDIRTRWVPAARLHLERKHGS